MVYQSNVGTRVKTNSMTRDMCVCYILRFYILKLAFDIKTKYGTNLRNVYHANL